MLRQKPIVISLVLAGLLASTHADALGLDRLNVTTALGQPLVAEVDLSVAPGDDVDSIRANIASPAVYRAANVEYQGIVQSIRVQVLRRANGQPYLRLASNQSINDPYLDILIEVNSASGRLVREYVFLLDPPATAVTQTIEPSIPARPVLPAQAAPAAPAAPAVAGAAAPVARSNLVTQSATLTPRTAAPAAVAGSYSVRSGDTLSGIAGRNALAGVTIEQLMIAIQRGNPDAFIGGNINRLRAGATLVLPASADAQAVTQTSAVNEVRAQAASWRGYVARVTDNVPSVASDQPSARASGRVSGAVADTGAAGANADKLKLSQGERTMQAGTESKVASAKALKEEQSRAVQLEKTKQDLEKALALKNQAFADAQMKAREAAKPAPTPPPAPVAAPVAIAKVEPPKLAPAPSPPVPVPAPAPAPVPPAPVPAPAPVVAPVVPPVVVAPPPAPIPSPPPPPPATPPAAVPRPATPPVASPAPTATPAAESGVLDFLGDNPMPAAGVGLGLLGLLGAFAWSRSRKKAAAGASSKLSDPVINTINPDTVFGTSGLGVVKTNDVPVQSQFSRSGMGTIDSGEVDPVAEAEVYIAYGREAQAEEILREALQRDPQRPDVATKLAEISATQGNRESFDKLVTDVAAMDRTGEYKQKLVGFAATHFPGHPLAGAAVIAAGASFASQAAAPAPTPAPFVAAVPVDTPTAPGRAAPPATDKGSLDFVLDGMTVGKANVSAEPVAPVAESVSVGPATTTAAAVAAVAAAVAAAPPSTMVSAPPTNRKSLEDDLAELEASLKKATTAGQFSESGIDFTDFSTATPTNLGTVGPSMRPEMLDLSFDAGRQGFVDPTPSILDGQWHDASTKLDLARAYEEMGDREGAREILREVIHDGDEVQITEAKAMLAKLGG